MAADDKTRPFIHGDTADGWDPVPGFTGVHYHPGGVVQRVSKIPGGGGLSGDFQSDDPRLGPGEEG
jgi:hypothetical protein